MQNLGLKQASWLTFKNQNQWSNVGNVATGWLDRQTNLQTDVAIGSWSILSLLEETHGVVHEMCPQYLGQPDWQTNILWWILEVPIDFIYQELTPEQKLHRDIKYQYCALFIKYIYLSQRLASKKKHGKPIIHQVCITYVTWCGFKSCSPWQCMLIS